MPRDKASGAGVERTEEENGQRDSHEVKSYRW